MKKIFAAVLALAALSLFCGCGAQKSAPRDDISGEYTEEYTAEAPAPAENGVIAEAEERGEGISGVSGADIAAPQSSGLKLVYTASYRLESEHFTDDYAQLKAAVAAAGGYISQENVSGREPEEYGDSGRSLSMEARVPSEKYEDFCNAVSGIGEVINRDASVEDISSAYYDTESRIALLETRYSKLNEHLAKATKMEDIITLESEMTQILFDLDTLKGERKHMDSLVSYSTVSIGMSEVVKSGAVATKGDVGSRAGEAFSGTLQGVGTFFEDFAVFFVGALPVLVVLGVIAVIVILIVKLCCRGAKKRRAAREARQAELYKSGMMPPPQGGGAPYVPQGFAPYPPQGCAPYAPPEAPAEAGRDETEK